MPLALLAHAEMGKDGDYMTGVTQNALDTDNIGNLTSNSINASLRPIVVLKNEISLIRNNVNWNFN